MEKKQKKQLSIPLIVKLHHSIVDSDNTEQNLEDFIEFMYPKTA